MNTKYFKVMFLVIIASFMVCMCGDKKQTNKYLGLWEVGDVIIVLEKDGLGNIISKFNRENDSIKWKQVDDYIVIESNIDKNINPTMMFCKLANTGEDRTMYVYDSYKFERITGVMIKKDQK